MCRRGLFASVLLLVLAMVAGPSVYATSDDGGPTPWIIGGTPATEQMGNLVVYIQLDGGFCSGSIIAPRWILTAAHCIESRAEIFGGSRIASERRSFGGATGFAHPSYTPPGFAYDVGLYRLDSPHPLGSVAVSLPTSADPSVRAPGTSTVAAGWGITSLQGDRPSVLLSSAATILDDAMCAQLDAVFGTTFASDVTFCTYADTTSTCSGDSGGPVWSTAGGQMVQIGLTSYGPGSCDLHSGVAYVPAVMDWITSTAGVGGSQTPPPTTPPPTTPGDGAVSLLGSPSR
jgi:secreted trypsin-like serine protease